MQCLRCSIQCFQDTRHSPPFHPVDRCQRVTPLPKNPQFFSPSLWPFHTQHLHAFMIFGTLWKGLIPPRVGESQLHPTSPIHRFRIVGCLPVPVDPGLPSVIFKSTSIHDVRSSHLSWKERAREPHLSLKILGVAFPLLTASTMLMWPLL